MKARLSGGPSTPESTAGRDMFAFSSEYALSVCCGIDGAMVGAVVAGMVVFSMEPILDMETGLVWRLSLGAGSGMDIFCAICATGSLN